MRNSLPSPTDAVSARRYSQVAVFRSRLNQLESNKILVAEPLRTDAVIAVTRGLVHVSFDHLVDHTRSLWNCSPTTDLDSDRNPQMNGSESEQSGEMGT